MAYLLLALLTLGVFRFDGDGKVPVPLRASLTLLLATLAVAGMTWSNLRLPKVRVAEGKGEELLAVWEGSAGTVAVVRDGDTLMTLFNNYYTLGAEVGSGYQAFMSHLPLLLHPSPSSVFYLGMGTGITAGGALAHPEVEEVVVTEIIPEAIEASRRYFGEYNGGLFEEERARIVPTDGRNYLAATGQRFDVIIAELFTPWKAGTANLFTREHFQILRGCLEEEGIFAQWIPLYQFSRAGFESVARTMAEVFPQVVLWRGDFQGGQSIACLLAMNRASSLDPGGIEERLANLRLSNERVPQDLGVLLAHYCGNIGDAKSLLASSPVSTDSRPYLEFLAPRLERETIAGQEDWLIGGRWAQLQRDLLAESPPREDVYWKNVSQPLSQAPLQGWLYQSANVLRKRGHSASPESLLREYRTILQDVGASPESALPAEEVLRFQSRLREFETLIESPVRIPRK
jgi:spermidine synthase